MPYYTKERVENITKKVINKMQKKCYHNSMDR